MWPASFFDTEPNAPTRLRAYEPYYYYCYYYYYYYHYYYYV